MVICLNNYRQAQTEVAQNEADEARLKNGTDGGDVTNMNRVPAQLYALHIPAQQTLSPDLPDDLSAVDTEWLMNRIRALASQV